MRISDKIIIVIFVVASIVIVYAAFISDQSVRMVLSVGLVLYVVVFISIFIISRRLSHQLIDLTFKVEEMAAGNLSKKLSATGDNQIDYLINALNELLVRLQTGVAQDVSTHKELAQAKTDFIAIASHQLRTPLSIVKWYIDYVLGGDAGEINDEQKKYLNEVYKSNERLIELVNALLDVSRIDLGTFSIEPEPTDIIEKATNAINKFIPIIKEKNITLEKQFDVIPIINLDPRLTEIVFENIISNAVKYTPANGTIRISVKKTKHKALIEVSDTGFGIPRSVQPKVFSKLFRADNIKKIESSGTGLGLYIAKAVIEKSGGKIWFQSPSLDLVVEEQKKGKKFKPDKENMGTSFFITIPLRGMKRKVGTKKLTSIEN